VGKEPTKALCMKKLIEAQEDFLINAEAQNLSEQELQEAEKQLSLLKQFILST